MQSVSPPTKLFDSSFGAFQVSVPSGASLFSLYRQGSATKPPLVLLHGYPQCHTIWHDVVHSLPTDLTLIIPDLPGYSRSTKKPSEDGTHTAHSKRAVASDIIALVDALFPGTKTKFILVGHDRGPRVSYRLSLDHSDRLKGVCIMGIAPLTEQFGRMRLEVNKHEETLRMYHWIFLALPPPLPETLIGHDPEQYIRFTIDSWTGSNTKGKIPPDIMRTWTDPYSQSPDVIKGSLEDYRAGATLDLDHEAEDRECGRKVTVPFLNLYSEHLTTRFNAEDVWNSKFDPSGTAKIRHVKIGDEGIGHFLPTEAAEETARALVDWLRDDIGIEVL
ncbi:hypothetical protein FRB94_012505 [Tulasnella sp. JGI-2019a]|nr:hypothetical protein FRB94_012505 [Tulasnella sp. JGI-2019a]